MARRFGSTPFYEILPHNIAQDQTMRQCADALDGILQKCALTIPELLVYARLANSPNIDLTPPLGRITDLAGGLSALPESLMDLLAWQYHVDAYETADTYEAKRDLILKSLMLHRRKGTPWAVRNALESAFQCPAEIYEWFDYDGEPYFFRVALDITNIEWPEKSTLNAFRIIFEYKNVRSWLEYLITRWKQPVHHHIGVTVRSDTAERTTLYFSPPEPIQANRFISAAVFGGIRDKLNFYSPPQQVPDVNQYYGFAINSFTNSEVGYYTEKSCGIIKLSFAQLGLTSSELVFYMEKPEGIINRYFIQLSLTTSYISPYGGNDHA